MTANKMQPETLEENRERLIAMSQAERAGFEAAAEGQMIPVREDAGIDADGPSQELHEAQDAYRLRRAVTDRADQDAAQSTRDTIVAEQVERRAARAEGRAPELKQAAPQSRKATRKASRKPDGE